MNKLKRKKYKLAAAVLALGLLGAAGTHGAFTDTLEVISHISTGDINIQLSEYMMKGSTEVAFKTPQTVLPGEEISKIPRITNLALPCWIRAKVIYHNEDEKLEGFSDQSLKEFGDGWVRRGEYYYYTSVLKRKASVDLFRAVSVPDTWKEEHSLQTLGLTIQAEAIQAANFKPDFTAMSPWGNQKIQLCVHEEDGTLTCRKESNKLSVEFSGKAHKLLAVPEDFFVNLGFAMPGDVLEESIALSNTTGNPAEIFFKTSTEGRSEEQLKLLKEIRLTIGMNGKTLYKGTLDSEALSKAHSLGTYGPGKTGSLDFRLEIPSEWDNSYALKKTDVTWIFSTSEQDDGDGGSGPDGNAGSGSTEQKNSGYQAQKVKTGDSSPIEIVIAVLLCSGAGIAVLCIRKGGSKIEKKN